MKTATTTEGADTGPMVNLNARVPKALMRRVKVACLTEGRLVRAYVADAIRERLDREQKR